MTLEHLEGTAYGPVTERLTAERVGAFVEATTDDPDRWADNAPPSIAGSLLFSVASGFLWGPDVGALSTVLVHTEQSFAWHGPLRVDDRVAVAGSVTRVRVRGQMNFVTFECAMDVDGTRRVDSVSNFLMGAEAAEVPPETDEPDVRFSGACDRPGESSTLLKSVSRVGLVRYAAASGDFNPVHYDHDAARSAGLPGIVVHGLLAMAWASQAASAGTTRSDPLVEMKARFRAAILPGAQVRVDAAPENDRIQVALESDGQLAVACVATRRTG